MPLTVAEVVALPVVQRGNPEVLSRCRWHEPIRWVHVSDLADLSMLLQGGELVLTTGVALAREPRTYLSGLAEAGAVGVIVEVGTEVPTLPSQTGATAEELGLALVVLHRRVRFVEVTEAVHRKLVAEQYDEVAFDRRVHETFTELSMKRASINGIVDAAARMLAEPVVLERAAAALAMHRMIEQDRTGLQHQAQSGLIDDVLRGRITDERDVAARAQALGLRRAAGYVPVTVRAARPRMPTDPVADHRRNIALLDTVAHTVNAGGHSALFSLQGDGEVGAILALKDSRGHGAEKAFTKLGVTLREEVRRVDGSESVLAVGSPAEQVTDAVAALAESAHVAEVALAMPTGGRAYFRASDVRLRGLVTLLREDDRLQRFAETELKALLDNDTEATPDHLTVLREYLRLAGNKAALAERLHMSRPALYKRLAAIRTALGVDLDDGESMTSLHVALMILDARGVGARR